MELLYLPAHSPDLNPEKEVFFKAEIPVEIPRSRYCV